MVCSRKRIHGHFGVAVVALTLVALLGACGTSEPQVDSRTVAATKIQLDKTDAEQVPSEALPSKRNGAQDAIEVELAPEAQLSPAAAGQTNDVVAVADQILADTQNATASLPAESKPQAADAAQSATSTTPAPKADSGSESTDPSKPKPDFAAQSATSTTVGAKADSESDSNASPELGDISTPRENSVPSGPGNWDMSVKSPELNNPVNIVLSKSYQTQKVEDFDRVGCEGLIYHVKIPDGRDAQITMESGSAALQYPLHVTGGRNVHLVGLEMRPVVQAGCDVGEAHQVRDTKNKNIHPRLPGGKVFRLEQSGTTFIEGIDIDLKGMEADCFVVRNPEGMSLAEALKVRHVKIVNTRCTGIEGLDESPIGDGIHGDFLQNQGKDNLGSLIVENVTYFSSSNGITLHNWHGKNAEPSLFKLRNLNYAADSRYASDDKYDNISGLAFTGHGRIVEFENVWLNEPRGLNYGIVNGKRLGAKSGGKITKADGINAGSPSTGDFAPENKTGGEYASPY